MSPALTSPHPGAARATPLSRAVRPHLNCCASPTEQQLSRRAALLSGAALPLLRVAPATAAPPVDWAAVKTEILAVISDPASPGGIGERGPTIVRPPARFAGAASRLTLTRGRPGAPGVAQQRHVRQNHAHQVRPRPLSLALLRLCVTHPRSGSGGATIRFTEELSHGANGGLDAPIAWLEPVAAAHPGLSHADLYTLAGATAVEAMGGPHVPWRAGRVDEVDPSKAAPDGRLPAADKGSPPRTAAALREVFGRMGFDDRGIVSLSGAQCAREAVACLSSCLFFIYFFPQRARPLPRHQQRLRGAVDGHAHHLQARRGDPGGGGAVAAVAHRRARPPLRSRPTHAVRCVLRAAATSILSYC